MAAGISVMNGASTERKISSSRMTMKMIETYCTWLPVLPDCFCWSTLTATWPARRACAPVGGEESVIAVRRLSTRSVIAFWLPWSTSDSTCSCAAWPVTVADGAEMPRSWTLTTVFTLARSAVSLTSHAWSAAVNVPPVRAATTGTGIRFVPPNGAASCAARSLGALAGRNALLLPCVTLASDGSARGMATKATTHAMSTTQRNLTANEPIARNMSSACTRPRIATGPPASVAGSQLLLRKRNRRQAASPAAGPVSRASVELRALRRARERHGLRGRRDRLRDQVEVAGARLALVLGGGVAERLVRELRLLQPHVRRHVLVRVAVRELEHGVVECVEPGEGDELEAVPHRRQFLLELGDRRLVQLRPPVERRRAVVGEHLVG